MPRDEIVSRGKVKSGGRSNETAYNLANAAFSNKLPKGREVSTYSPQQIYDAKQLLPKIMGTGKHASPKLAEQKAAGDVERATRMAAALEKAASQDMKLNGLAVKVTPGGGLVYDLERIGADLGMSPEDIEGANINLGSKRISPGQRLDDLSENQAYVGGVGDNESKRKAQFDKGIASLNDDQAILNNLSQVSVLDDIDFTKEDVLANLAKPGFAWDVQGSMKDQLNKNQGPTGAGAWARYAVPALAALVGGAAIASSLGAFGGGSTLLGSEAATASGAMAVPEAAGLGGGSAFAAESLGGAGVAESLLAGGAGVAAGTEALPGTLGLPSTFPASLPAASSGALPGTLGLPSTFPAAIPGISASETLPGLLGIPAIAEAGGTLPAAGANVAGGIDAAVNAGLSGGAATAAPAATDAAAAGTVEAALANGTLTKIGDLIYDNAGRLIGTAAALIGAIAEDNSNDDSGSESSENIDPLNSDFWNSFVDEWMEAKGMYLEDDEFRKSKVEPAIGQYQSELTDLANQAKTGTGNYKPITYGMGDFRSSFVPRSGLKVAEDLKNYAKEGLTSELALTDVMQPNRGNREYLNDLIGLAKYDRNFDLSRWGAESGYNLAQQRLDYETTDKGTWLDAIKDIMQVGDTAQDIYKKIFP